MNSMAKATKAKQGPSPKKGPSPSQGNGSKPKQEVPTKVVNPEKVAAAKAGQTLKLGDRRPVSKRWQGV
jgi:hypothetical protein